MNSGNEKIFLYNGINTGENEILIGWNFITDGINNIFDCMEKHSLSDNEWDEELKFLAKIESAVETMYNKLFPDCPTKNNPLHPPGNQKVFETKTNNMKARIIIVNQVMVERFLEVWNQLKCFIGTKGFKNLNSEISIINPGRLMMTSCLVDYAVSLMKIQCKLDLLRELQVKRSLKQLIINSPDSFTCKSGSIICGKNIFHDEL
jgi:hypothetical protein